MKNKKKFLIIAGSVAAVILTVILCVVLIPDKEEPVSTPETSETEVKTEIVIDCSEDASSEEMTTEEINAGEIIDDGSGLKPVVKTEESKETSKEESKTDTEQLATPVVEKTVEKETSNDDSGIVIGNTPEPEAYSCGAAGHHCSCAEVHALISNYELEGCQYCGSHSCPSFYATDEWGQTCYDVTKCPSYNIKNDPVYYCQDCGKKCGDGQNGTCAIYNIDIDCPYCNEHVEAWTCHSCK